MDVLSELSSVPDTEPAPPAEDEQQRDNKPCKDKMECNDFRKGSHRLKDVIKSYVLTFLIPFLQTGTNLSPFQQLLLTLMRLKMNLPLSLLGCIFKILIPTASRTFRSTIELLNARLVPALFDQIEKSFSCQ